MALHPTSELVILSWLATLPGITSGMVANDLPKDTGTWSANGFVTAVVAGGVPDPYIALRQPLVQLDFWACSPNAQRPSWGKAHALAETAINAGIRSGNGHLDVTVKTGYGRARIHEVWPVMEPQRLRDDASAYARVRCDFRATWSEL